MDHLGAKDWLEREDAVCREGRQSRWEWLAGLMPQAECLAFPGGWVARYLFEESRYCFVYGQFMATVVLGMAYIEHTLAGLFYAAGRSDLERARISDLLAEAVAVGWLSQDEYEHLDGARALRNPVVHFRRPLYKDTVEYRSATENEMPYTLLEEDACHVMQAVLHVLALNAV